MKRSLLPLVALTVLLGACNTTPTASQRVIPATSTGTRATAWGNLPTYDQRHHRFKNLSGRPPATAFNGPVALDMLVNRDGSVQGITLVQSSGNQRVDEVIKKRFTTGRYTLLLGPDDPAPYVVRQYVVSGDVSPQPSYGANSAQNTRPLPAQTAGTVVTPWGEMTTYKFKGNAFVLNPHRAPAPGVAGVVEVDVLVERDGTVRDVFVRKVSGFAVVDSIVAAQFKESRSRLILAPTDPAPYVIRDSLANYVSHDTTSRIPQSSHNDSRFSDNRPMGTGAPYWGDRTN